MDLHRLDPDAARKARDAIASVYADAYADLIAAGDPYESLDAVMDRFDAQLNEPGFALVQACHGAEPVGQSWGWTLRADGPQWGVLGDGTPTFGLAEIMTRAAWEGQGIGRAVHDALLAPRTESRAVLLVDPANTRARAAYLSWGWHFSGRIRPGTSGPDMEIMVRDLPG